MCFDREMGNDAAKRAKAARPEKFIPIEIKIVHTDQQVHLREGQHVITVMVEFKPNSGNRAAQPNHGAIRGSVVLLGCNPAGVPIVSISVVIERSGKLRFLVGFDTSHRLVVVFDDMVDQHADRVPKLHHLRPLGGGWIEVDLAEKRRQEFVDVSLCMLAHHRSHLFGTQ
jgi:hypothetical protein